MELEERLSYLENVRDWQSLVEELEKGIASSAANAAKAQFHLKLGRVLETKFLAGVKALKHFQDAYKLNPGADREPRGGAQRLLGPRQAEHGPEAPRAGAQGRRRRARGASALLLELGDVLCDQGDWEKAAATLRAQPRHERRARPGGERVPGGRAARAGQRGKSTSPRCSAARTRPTTRPPRRGCCCARRASRGASRPTRPRGCWRAPTPPTRPTGRSRRSTRACSPSRGGSTSSSRRSSEILAADRRPQARARALALAFGTRWVLRHQNIDIGARFLEEALQARPRRTRARSSSCARRTARRAATGIACSRIAEEAATRADDGGSTFLLAQAGTIAWRQLGNLIRARLSFERLSAVSPEHPQLRAFEAQIGETLQASAAQTRRRRRRRRRPALERTRTTCAPRRRRRAVQAESRRGAPRPRHRSLPRADARGSAVAQRPPPAPPAPPRRRARGSGRRRARRRAARRRRPPSTRRRSPSCAQLADKQEAAKRYNEYVKTLLQLAALVPDADEKVALYTKAADLYVSKFANQAEAVKAYEAVLAIDPDNAQAVDYLRQMYEKRRDWEKLLGLQRREAERMPPGAERAREVPRDRQARDRAGEEARGLHRPLAGGPRQRRLERRGARRARRPLRARQGLRRSSRRCSSGRPRSPSTRPRKIQVLTKLGTIYGERLNNDEGAVNAWRALLALDPNDRRAQDALKKKYLALGRWDDLEVFYAESGKWDEFIRVLEQQEAKETEPAGEDLAPLQDRPALGRQEAEARSRRQGLREGARARGRQPAGGRGAHPHLHGGEQRARRSPTPSR